MYTIKQRSKIAGFYTTHTDPAMELIRRTCPEAMSPTREASSNGSDSRSGGTCNMPVAPPGVLTWSGVIVEPGEGSSFYVKVLHVYE